MIYLIYFWLLLFTYLKFNCTFGLCKMTDTNLHFCPRCGVGGWEWAGFGGLWSEEKEAQGTRADDNQSCSL